MGKRKAKKLAEKEARQMEKEMKKEKARKRRRKCLLLAIVVGGAMAARASQKPKQTPGNGTVTLKDAEPGPLAFMMSEMVKVLLQDPSKKALADRMNVSVAIQDLDNREMAATMSFRGSDVTVANGAEGADIYIGTELALLLSLSGAGKGKQMLQWLKTDDGKKVINAVKSGRFKVRGAVKNAPQMALFQKFLTPTG
ncbi:MAG: hypothetical protein JW854_16920 [Actinobacteria bacterium]|nr:hypothetical protein [Actinomycetota bacterium]